VNKETLLGLVDQYLKLDPRGTHGRFPRRWPMNGFRRERFQNVLIGIVIVFTASAVS